MEYYKKERHTTLSLDKIKHCKSVADYMQENADLFGVDKDVAYFIGLNHDIGYVNGRIGHEESGYELLKNVGVNSKILYAIINHGHDPYTMHEETIIPELQLLWCADMSVDKFGTRVGFDGRLDDIKRRYGEEHIAYKTASNTIKYCKEVLKEKTDLQYDDIEFENKDYLKLNAKLYNKFCLDYDFMKEVLCRDERNFFLLPKIRFMENGEEVFLSLQLPEYKDTLIHSLNRAFAHKDFQMEYVNELLFGDKNITLPGEDIKKLKDTLRVLNEYRQNLQGAEYYLNDEELENLEERSEVPSFERSEEESKEKEDMER